MYNMTLHLSTGSPEPPPSDKLRLYSMRFCPYAQRVHLTLIAKNIPYDTVWVNMSDKPEWFASKSSSGKVPVLELPDGTLIHEGHIAAEYVDESFPETRLTSKDPLRRAHDRLVVQNFNKCIQAYYNALFENTDTSRDLIEGLREVQNHLIERGTKFLHGDEKPGFVDYMLWPMFERFPILKGHGGDKYAIDWDKKFKKLFAWTTAMKQDPAVKEYILSPEIHVKYIRGRLSGENKYDGLI